jgi:hypothetical protein
MKREVLNPRTRHLNAESHLCPCHRSVQCCPSPVEHPSQVQTCAEPVLNKCSALLIPC